MNTLPDIAPIRIKEPVTIPHGHSRGFRAVFLPLVTRAHDEGGQWFLSIDGLNTKEIDAMIRRIRAAAKINGHKASVYTVWAPAANGEVIVQPGVYFTVVDRQSHD
ncbi:MAG: hypothetical protein ACRENM_02985 [Candidatus Dormibacteraceae bacterium]